MASRRSRLALTGIAVVLGSAFIAAALVLTASIEATVDELNEDAYVGSEALVEPVEPETRGERLVREGVSAESLAAIEGDPDVAGTSVTVSWMINAIGSDGKIVGGFAPTIAVNWGDESIVRELREGRAPEADGEVAVSAAFVDAAGFGLGDTVTAYSLASEETEYDIVGVFGYSGGRDSLGGATELAFTMPEAQRLVFEGQDAYTAVAVSAADGVTDDELVERLAAVIGDEATAITVADYNEETSAETAEAVRLIGFFLLGFGLIAVFVSMFLIANTFTIVITGRLKEFAMLRAIGAGRGQVVRSVLVEALALGTGAAVIGAALGVGGGIGLASLASNQILDTASFTTAVPVSAVLAALAVGIGVTVLSALLPALRASRIMPVEAMRDAAKTDKPITGITVLGSFIAGLGTALMIYGLAADLGDRDIAYAAGGAALAFIGLTLLTPWLSRPLVGMLGLVWSWSFAGKLGRRNAARNPRRTAVTAAALMIGVTLVTTAATLMMSIEKSLDASLDDNVAAELFVTGPVYSSVPGTFDPALMEDMRAVEGVDAAAELYYDPAKIDGAEQIVYASSDLSGGLGLYGVPVEQGSIADLADDEIAVSASTAQEAGVGLDDTVSVEFTRGDEAHEFTVAAVLADSDNISGWFATPALAEEFYTPEPTEALIDVADSADIEAVSSALDGLLADEPEVSVQNREEYIEELTVMFDFAIIAIQALLGLAMIVAVIGVINTLVLSILERTRELGMLRAIGMTRGQSVRMVTVESLTITLFGAVLGIGVGLVLAWVAQRALVEEGVEIFAVPTALIVGYLAAAVVVGLLAAIAPAMRASRVNILGAIAYE
ncbi:ABC transporter permease [Glycomyces salinus]|uniref:ABC transporter permease n=1 Tax=Glycomyces salinus TaxID=980294 RepID=UPI0018EC9675|nr:FtsX-like permease family protein [Glycomyces salinus]